MQEFTPKQTSQQYILYSDASTELVENFKATYDLLVISSSAYDDFQNVLNSELDKLINVHFEDVMTRLDGAMSRLDALSNDFPLKSNAWNVYSTIQDSYISIKASAENGREVNMYIYLQRYILANKSLYHMT